VIVITLTKNSAATIRDTITSLKLQKFKNFDWFIFDERSTDSTINIIKKSNLPFKIFYTNSNSLYKGYNSALRLIIKKKIKDIIFFLHSDDIIENQNVLKDVNNIFIKYKSDILYGNIKYFKKNNKKTFREWNAKFEKKQIKINSSLFLLKKFYKKDFIKGWMFPHTSLFFHSNILNNLLFYDTKYRISADYLWSLKLLLKKQLRVFFWNSYVVNMRYGGASTDIRNTISIFIEDWKILHDFYNRQIFNTVVALFFKKIKKITQFFNIGLR
jgi:glycosyltransferase